MKNIVFKTSVGILAFTLMGCIVNSVYTFTAQLVPVVGITTNATGYMDGSTQDSNSRLVASGRYSGLGSAATSIEIVSPTRTCVLNKYPDSDPRSGGFEGLCNGPATQADIDNLNNGQTRIVVKGR
jgi:hypothetical protein